ncbi:hypothetical protein [Methylocystis parvus]|uniref:Uncharacterized protein n=1 Tax=Methylocystis parvus TaxID=134 RepID=A0A6B8MAI4_9HYPH|nr:hypothetical protein [Methylocystis parvus]QGM98293.1 hypothetical protein F7D14_12940 [Methylocystis parvus]WBK01380.1 hypothetical protein MMG94_06635 [Methylocystis parvus OBBP]
MNIIPKRFFATATAGALTLAQTAGALALPAAPLPDAGAETTQIRGGFHGGHATGLHGRPSTLPAGGWHGGSAGWGRPGRPGGYPANGHWHGGHYHGGSYGAWRRPYYGWGPGGAIAAGAAIGFLSAAAAATYAASAAPAAGLCWYYTDATRRAGFWDYCP